MTCCERKSDPSPQILAWPRPPAILKSLLWQTSPQAWGTYSCLFPRSHVGKIKTCFFSDVCKDKCSKIKACRYCLFHEFYLTLFWQTTISCRIIANDYLPSLKLKQINFSHFSCHVEVCHVTLLNLIIQWAVYNLKSSATNTRYWTKYWLPLPTQKGDFSMTWITTQNWNLSLWWDRKTAAWIHSNTTTEDLINLLSDTIAPWLDN